MSSDVANAINSLLNNTLLLSCLSSWFCAQFIKTVINILSGRVHKLTQLLENLIWMTGGLPSSHCAMVTSLTTCIGFRDGVNSDIFMLSLGFLMVTIRDAVGVRRSNGIQAQKLNLLGRQLKEKGLVDYTTIKEVNGHTPLEVTLGCLLGLFIGIGFSVFSQ